MSSPYPYSFEGAITRHGVGVSRVLWYRVLFLPPPLAAQLPFDQFPRLRVEGEVADLPVAGAWMPVGDGRRYFMVSPRLMRTAELSLGDLVEMRFRIADQDAVDMPEALADALAGTPDMAAAWAALTPGRQRALAHHVGSAKAVATQARCAGEVLVCLRDHGGDLRRLRSPRPPRAG